MINKLKKTIIPLLIIFPGFIFLGGPNISGSGGNGKFNWGANVAPTYGSACDAVQCVYSYSYNKNTDYYVEMKDMYGNTTIAENGSFGANSSNKFLAGTYVMLKVYQKQGFESTASYQVMAKRQVWGCRYYNYKFIETICLKGELPNGECIGDKTKDVYNWVEEDSIEKVDCSCPDKGYKKTEPYFVGWRDVTGEYSKACSSGATPQEFDVGSMFVAEYRDSNDVDDKTVTRVEGHECTTQIKELDKTTDRDGSESGGKTLSGECNVSYDREATICINVKTGKVRYSDENKGGQCNQDEYLITPDKDGYWKYFIPLNANSADDFSFELKSSGYAEDAEMCEAYKEAYPNNWQNIIKMNSDGTCTFELKVTIPIEQKFYNEVNKGNNFKGFNFYYKPIDIDNPFPNGVTQSSLWYDWSKGKNQEPDISESYKEVTYIAEHLDGESLRNYNKYDDAAYRKLYRTWYSDWQENMDVDGSSDFIDEGEYVTRYVNRDSYYPLGCGPANTNVNNIFTQKECNKR